VGEGGIFRRKIMGLGLNSGIITQEKALTHLYPVVEYVLPSPALPSFPLVIHALFVLELEKLGKIVHPPVLADRALTELRMEC